MLFKPQNYNISFEERNKNTIFAIILKQKTMAAHNDLGFWGEQVAADYLTSKGYRILHRNWQCGRRDIDIVATDMATLVIVEVKTRRNNSFTEPEAAVDRQKIKSLAIAANSYIKQLQTDMPVRFDIITVTGTPDTDFRINHIADAFMPY